MEGVGGWVAEKGYMDGLYMGGCWGKGLLGGGCILYNFSSLQF